MSGVMKKFLSKLLVIVAMITCGCGSSRNTEIVSMYDLRVAMEAADDSLPSMLNASSAEENAEENFKYISDLDYSKVDSYFVSYSEEGLADEIAVIAVKDPQDVKEAKESLEDHRDDRYKLLEQYEPEEVKRIEDGIVFSTGSYAVLIICDDPGAVRAAFEDAVSGEE